ncbi:hypothetical protein [Arthrobacter terrae]|uniref:hypothetical protein n=1 Tax=Arthrobacter terrae TaxID=2935737 RepID=UPI0028AC2D3A|nr:hypothetical protein [Arthrobacter terrae]
MPYPAACTGRAYGWVAELPLHACRQKSETKVRRFIAAAGHELRTPLTASTDMPDCCMPTEF